MSLTLRVLLVLLCTSMMLPGTAQAGGGVSDAVRSTVNQVWASESIEDEQLQAADCPTLRVYKNAVYARHGFNFSEFWVRAWFLEHEPRWTPIESVTNVTVRDQLSRIDVTTHRAVKKWEERRGCDAYWKGLEREQVEAGAPESRYASVHLEQISTDARGTLTVVAGTYKISPQFLVSHQFNNLEVTAAWLEPFTCGELESVERSLRGHSRPSNRDSLTLLRVVRQQRQRGCESEERPSS